MCIRQFYFKEEQEIARDGLVYAIVERLERSPGSATRCFDSQGLPRGEENGSEPPFIPATSFPLFLEIKMAKPPSTKSRLV